MSRVVEDRVVEDRWKSPAFSFDLLLSFGEGQGDSDQTRISFTTRAGNSSVSRSLRPSCEKPGRDGLCRAGLGSWHGGRVH